MPQIINYLLVLFKALLVLLLILAFISQLSIYSYNYVVRGEDMTNFNFFLLLSTYYLSNKIHNT